MPGSDHDSSCQTLFQRPGQRERLKRILRVLCLKHMGRGFGRAGMSWGRGIGSAGRRFGCLSGRSDMGDGWRKFYGMALFLRKRSFSSYLQVGL